MDFRSVLPIIDAGLIDLFRHCKSNEDFLNEIANLYSSATDPRVKEASLAVYLAYRDHYPKYLKSLSSDQIKSLDQEVEVHFVRLIKLRRLALAELVKVA